MPPNENPTERPRRGPMPFFILSIPCITGVQPIPFAPARSEACPGPDPGLRLWLKSRGQAWPTAAAPPCMR